MSALRRICLDARLVETAKWGHPCYMHAGRNVAILGAFRDGVRLSFFDAALLQDPGGVLQRQGTNTAHPDMLPFADARQVAAQADTIRAFLKQAMGHSAAGLRPMKAANTPVLPDDLVTALDADPDLAAAFAGLTPGRQRSYVIALASARTAATRNARIARFRDRILSGKGATER